LDGTLIAVGLPWDGTVFIQEYWSQGIPHYAIANGSTETAEIAVAEWHGVVGRRLMGPWTVAPNTVQCCEIKHLVTDYSGSLIAVSLNTNPIYGLLRAPKPLSGLIDWEKLEGILTIEGLNGTGDRNANIRCLQPQLVFDPGQTISLKLQIPENIGTLFFEETGPPGRLPQATVTGVTSNTLSVEVRDGSFVVGVQQMPGPAIHEIALAVKIPEVEVETMAAFFGRVASSSGAGFYFGRGLIVRVL
jgi:hypothetical protein